MRNVSTPSSSNLDRSAPSSSNLYESDPFSVAPFSPAPFSPAPLWPRSPTPSSFGLYESMPAPPNLYESTPSLSNPYGFSVGHPLESNHFLHLGTQLDAHPRSADILSGEIYNNPPSISISHPVCQVPESNVGWADYTSAHSTVYPSGDAPEIYNNPPSISISHPVFQVPASNVGWADYTSAHSTVYPSGDAPGMWCCWVNEDGSICRESISYDCATHLATAHGISKTASRTRVACRWCSPPKQMKRESIVRHVREVHLRRKRRDKERA